MYTKYQLGFPWNQNHQKLHKNSKKKKKRWGGGLIQIFWWWGGEGGGRISPVPHTRGNPGYLYKRHNQMLIWCHCKTNFSNFHIKCTNGLSTIRELKRTYRLQLNITIYFPFHSIQHIHIWYWTKAIMASLFVWVLYSTYIYVILCYWCIICHWIVYCINTANSI